MEVAILPEVAIDNSQRNANCVCCMCCSLPFHDVESVVGCKCPIVVCVRNSTLLVGLPYGQQRINELLSLFYESVQFLVGDVVVAELNPAILVDELNVAARSIGVKPGEALKASLPETQRKKSLFRMHTETELIIGISTNRYSLHQTNQRLVVDGWDELVPFGVSGLTARGSLCRGSILSLAQSRQQALCWESQLFSVMGQVFKFCS
jgi:hypothetical protein